MTKLLVLLGTARKTGNGHRVGAWIKNTVAADERFELDYVETTDLELPFFDEAASPNWNGGNYANPKGAAWAKRVGEADAVLFISPEYNHSYSAILKNAIDWVGPEWRKKPAGIVTYSVSPFGGIRAAEHLRNVLAELDTVSLHDTIGIPFVDQAVSEDGTATNEHLDGQLKTMLDLLVA